MPILTPEAWAQIRADYEHSETPIEDICAEHGISSGTLRDRVRRWRWTRRHQPIPTEGPPPLPMPPRAPPLDLDAPPAALSASALPAEGEIAPAPPVFAPQVVPEAVSIEPAAAPPEADPAAIVPRLQGAVARVLPAIETILGKLAAGPSQPREMERAARALAALTRTLRELNALLSQHQAAAIEDDIPDIDAFRLDLARRIELFVASRSGEDGDGGEPEA
jgi:transposase-like protein